MNHLRDAIREIPDFPKQGILFRDITTLLKNGSLFRQASTSSSTVMLARASVRLQVLRSRGFLIGSLWPNRLTGRNRYRSAKAGKLPHPPSPPAMIGICRDKIQIHQDALQSGKGGAHR